MIKCSICPYYQTLTRTPWTTQENDQRHVTHSHINSSFMELPIHIGLWIDSGRKGERQRPSGSLSDTNESFWTQPGRGDRNQRFHSSTESTLRKSLERYPKCCILGAIIKSAGSRIGILADEVLCNHDLRYDTRRPHWQNNFWRRNSSTFRTTWNAEAGTQGNVKNELAQQTAAAFHFTHTRY